MSGALAKLNIQAYSEAEMTEGSKVGSLFVTTLNPEKYTLGFSNEYNVQPAVGSSHPTPQYKGSAVQDLSIDFLFDQTGALSQKKEGADLIQTKGVDEQIQDFLNLAYDFQGAEHKPNYLKISWGKFTFNCLLKEVQIEHKLFQADGKPIRAVAKAKFISFVSELKRIATEKKSSPDLTHVRMVNAGDTLPLMCYRIYGDSKYYIEVAKANQIASFRTLIPGQQIYFPPIEKRS